MGIAVASGFEQARRLALDLLDAIVRGDEAQMTRHLGEYVARALPFIGPADRHRDRIVASAAAASRRRSLDHGTSIVDLIGEGGLEVAPVSSFLDDRPVPSGLLETDLVVRIPLSDLGRATLRRILPGWMAEGRIIVRNDAIPHIVGL